MYYNPSGKLTPISFLWLLLLCATAFPLIGLLYTYAIWYIPFIYINFLITAVFGGLVGIIISAVVVKYGKVRNVAVAALMGFIGTLVAFYCSWAVWVDMVINAGESYGNKHIGITVSNISTSETIGLLLNPVEVFKLAVEINEYGTWGFKGTTVSGIFLAIIWLVEALIVLVIGTMFSIWQAKEPFCEESGTWAESKTLPPMAFIENTQSFTQNIENGHYGDVETIEKATLPSSEKHSELKLYYTTLGAYYLSVTNKTPKVEKDKITFDEKVLFKYLTVSSKVGNKLLGM